MINIGCTNSDGLRGRLALSLVLILISGLAASVQMTRSFATFTKHRTALCSNKYAHLKMVPLNETHWVGTYVDMKLTLPQRRSHNNSSTGPVIPYNATHLPKLAFLHLGKTAGTTLSFQINGACMNPSTCVKYRPVVKNETLTAQAVVQYFHVYQIRSFNPASFDGYIIPVRNPIHRVVSAYNMYHPANDFRNKNPILMKLMVDCYPQPYDMAQYGLVDQPPISVMSARNNSLEFFLSLPCKDLAYSTVAGMCHLKNLWHFYYNYQRYYGKVLQHLQRRPDKLALVVRQEHIWSDWSNLNVLLGGRDNVKPKKVQVVHDSREFAEHDTNVSRIGYENLCRVLKEEIRVYLQVLRKATNLNDSDVMEAIDDLQELCGGSLVINDLLKS